jgi:hypothetical protein
VTGPEALLAKFEHVSDKMVFFGTITNVNLGIWENKFQSIFKTIMESSLVTRIFEIIRNSENSFQKLCIIQTIQNIEDIFEWNLDPIDLMHGFRCRAEVVSWLRYIHNFHEMDEAAKGNHGIFLFLEPLLL